MPAVNERTGEVYWPVPLTGEDRVELLATLVATKETTDVRGLPRLSGMFLCECNEGRFKLWGTVPTPLITAIQDAVAGGVSGATLKGSLVKFSAIVSRSKDDETFGFFMRPSKAQVLLPGYNNRER